MKTCPICGCKAFDDAQTCYGCLHPFGDETPVGARGEHAESKNRVADGPTRFVVSFSPAFEGGRTVWSCSVEPVST